MNKSTLSAISILMSAGILLVGCGKAQEGESGPSGRTASRNAPAITKCIPAGSLYYMTNSISKTIDSTEMFLIDIGLGPMMGISVSRPGDDRPRDSVLMTQLKQAFRLGEGFDPKGAAAFVMINPQAAGVDLVKELEAHQERTGSARVSRNFDGIEDKLQELMAFVAPGTIKTLFIKAELTTEGRLTVIDVGGPKLYAAQKGPYVILSPTKTAINTMLDAKKIAAEELSDDEIEMIEGSELAVHYSVGPYRPLMEKMLNDLIKEFQKGPDKVSAAGFAVYATMARASFEQLDATTIGVKLGQNGVNIDSICTPTSGSAAAKIFKAESTNAGGAKTIDSLPSLPYVAAMGVDGWFDNPDFHAAMTDLSKMLMGPDSIYKVDEKTKARLLELQTEMAGMVTGVQVVIGAAPKDKGMFNLSYVIRCKDSAKYLSVFPESTELTNKMMANMKMAQPSPKISMTFTKGAEKIGDLSVDSMDIVLSEVPELDPKELSKILKMVLGEESIRMLIATPDPKTLVMTLGGSTEALAEALKVASGGGPIPAEPGTALAMRNLPENPSIVALLNAGNLLDVIREGMKTAGAPVESIKMVPEIKCKTPIAFGLSTKGATLRTGLFVAKPLIRDSVQAVMATFFRAAVAGAQPE